jgi:hypothetical protein
MIKLKALKASIKIVSKDSCFHEGKQGLFMLDSFFESYIASLIKNIGDSIKEVVFRFSAIWEIF